MAYNSRMNGLNLKTSQTAAKSPAGEMKTNLGNLGATVKKLKPSNSPGPMTSPSVQGPTQPITKRS